MGLVGKVAPGDGAGFVLSDGGRGSRRGDGWRLVVIEEGIFSAANIMRDLLDNVMRMWPLRGRVMRIVP